MRLRNGSTQSIARSGSEIRRTKDLREFKEFSNLPKLHNLFIKIRM